MELDHGTFVKFVISLSSPSPHWPSVLHPAANTDKRQTKWLGMNICNWQTDMIDLIWSLGHAHKPLVMQGLEYL